MAGFINVYNNWLEQWGNRRQADYRGTKQGRLHHSSEQNKTKSNPCSSPATLYQFRHTKKGSVHTEQSTLSLLLKMSFDTKQRYIKCNENKAW